MYSCTCVSCEIDEMLAKLFAFILFLITVAEAGSSKYEWVDEVGLCKMHYIPATWQEALISCQFEGGEMASKPRQLTKLVQEAGRDRVFLGIHSTFAKGYYYSIGGTPLESIAVEWAPHEPDNFEDSERCLALNANGTVADVNCSHVLPYICCLESDISTDQGAKNDGYVCEESLGSCYKFHSTGMMWSQAFKVCAAESGYLAIVNSQREAQYLEKFASGIPISSMKADHKDFSYIGFLYWGEPPTWMTIHGQSLDNAGYSVWGTGQPDNSTAFRDYGENCGGIFFRPSNDYSKFNDVSCEKTLTFICEKPLTSDPIIFHV